MSGPCDSSEFHHFSLSIKCVLSGPYSTEGPSNSCEMGSHLERLGGSLVVIYPYGVASHSCAYFANHRTS